MEVLRRSSAHSRVLGLAAEKEHEILVSLGTGLEEAKSDLVTASSFRSDRSRSVATSFEGAEKFQMNLEEAPCIEPKISKISALVAFLDICCTVVDCSKSIWQGQRPRSIPCHLRPIEGSPLQNLITV